MQNWLRPFAAGLLATGVAYPAWADEPQSPSASVCAEGLRQGVLSNGFRYSIRCIADPALPTQINLVIQAGAVHGGRDAFALAHLTEHVVFGNIRDQETKGSLRDRADRWGLSWGADINAATGFLDTTYVFRLPVGTPASLDDALEVVANWASPQPKADIEAERGAVLGELRAGLTSGWRVESALDNALYGSNNAFVTNPDADSAFLKSATSGQVSEFLDKWYRPDAEGLTIVGNVDVARAEEIVRRRFAAGVKGAASPIPPPLAPLSASDDAIVFTDAVGARSLKISFRRRDTGLGTVMARQADLAADIVFAEALRSRLDRLTELPGAPFRQIGVAPSLPTKAAITALQVRAEVEPDQWENAAREVASALQSVRTFGFTPNELSAAKAVTTKRRGSTPTSMSIMFEQDQARLLGRPVPVKAGVSDLQQVSLADLLRAAPRLLPDAGRLIVAENPAKAPGAAPSLTGLKVAFGQAWASKAKRASADTALVIDSAPLSAQAAVLENEVSVGSRTGLRFSNGLTFIFAPSGKTNGLLSLLALSPIGARDGTEQDQRAARIAEDAITAGKIAGLTPKARASLLGEKGVNVVPFIDPSSSGVRANGRGQDLDLMLRLVRDYLLAGDPGEPAFEAWRRREIDRASSGQITPRSTFETLVRAAETNDVPDDPYFLSRVSRQDVVSAYKRRLGDPARLVFVIAGDFDPNEVRPLIARFAASFRGSGHPGSVPPKDIEKTEPTTAASAAPNKRVVVRLGSEGSAVVSLQLGLRVIGDVNYSPACEDLRKELLLRLWSRLREKEKGTYDVLVNLNWHDGRLSASADFYSAFDNVDHMASAAKEEMFGLLSDAKSGAWKPEVAVAPVPRGADSPSLAEAYFLADGDLRQALDPLGDRRRLATTAEVAALLLTGRYQEYVMLPEGAE